jgi:Ni/Fe-hydrogenase 1 B-type cytochrome subunit
MAASTTMAPPIERGEPVARPGSELVRVYVWEVPVRVTHWVIALAIVVLSVTGFYIGNPFIVVHGPAGQRFVMGTMKIVHVYAGIAFTLAVLARVAWMFLGNTYASWDKFIPVRAARRSGIWPTIKFYLFLLRKPPGFVGHNPVAGLAYCAVFTIYFVLILTGFTLYGASAHVDSPLRAFAALAPYMGGLQVARWIHHVCMWLLLGFAVHHVYSSLLMSQVEQNATVESIFSGYKFVPREDLEYSGYRFVPRGHREDEDDA